MSSFPLAALVCLASLLPAAHALRWHGLWPALAWLAPLACLALTRRPFARLAVQAALVLGALDLAHTGAMLAGTRLAMGLPVIRLAAIMTGAVLLPLGAALVLAWAQDRTLGRTGRDTAPTRGGPGFLACALVFAALSLVERKGPPGLLLADRFAAGAGWLEAALLALYAGFVAQGLADPARSPTVRRTVWTAFSLVFFLQLGLGLAGFPRFLFNASPHLPVPALILAGPLYRGEGLFMPILFALSALLAGPAWCSHLCYVGAWDDACARTGTPRPAPAWMARGRAGLALCVPAAAWGLRLAGVGPAWAGALAAGFGLVGVGVMLFVSRRAGYMAHCAGFCPMGLVAGLLGRLSPWRLRIGPDCTACGACARACRYNALRPEHLAARRPGLSCSLCLDCLPRCPKGSLTLTAFGRDRPLVRTAFAVLAACLHTVFLGLARM